MGGWEGRERRVLALFIYQKNKPIRNCRDQNNKFSSHIKLHVKYCFLSFSFTKKKVAK